MFNHSSYDIPVRGYLFGVVSQAGAQDIPRLAECLKHAHEFLTFTQVRPAHIGEIDRIMTSPHIHKAWQVFGLSYIVTKDSRTPFPIYCDILYLLLHNCAWSVRPYCNHSCLYVFVCLSVCNHNDSHISISNLAETWSKGWQWSDQGQSFSHWCI